MLMDAAESQLLIVDMQERLLPAMCSAEAATVGCVRLLKAASVLDMPVTASQQYPKGLGPTVAPVADLVPAEAFMDKVHFACSADPDIMRRIEAAGRKQVIIGGVEAHVCVLQTAISLQAKGYSVYVVVDAVSSREAASIDLARHRLAANGVELINSEMALFEWMGKAGTPVFKELSALVK